MRVTWGLVLIAVLPLLTDSSSTADNETGSKLSSKSVEILRLLKKILQDKRNIEQQKSGAIKTGGGTAAGANCVFPFIYEGNTIYACICKYSSKPWCATTNNYDTDKKWGYCIQDASSTAVAFGKSVSGTCALPFVYKGKKFNSCTCYDKQEVYPWCSVSLIYELHRSRRFCAVTVCPAGYCKNEGLCIVEGKPSDENVPHFRCACKPGYDGALCEMKACPSDYCKNGGKCNIEKDREGYKFKCACAAFFSGPRCEKKAACGVRSTSPERRIVGGVEATAHQWPWQAGIVYSPYGNFVNPQLSYHKCGGTVIAPFWILTAAHCVETRPGYKDLKQTHYRIKLGDHSGNTVEPSEETREVEKIIVYPEWDYTTMTNDIALIKVTKEIIYNRDVQPICLPTKKAVPNQFCYLTGWGQTNGQVWGKAPELMEVELKLLPQKECKGLNQFNKEHVHCFGYAEGKHKGACRGDSGGPVNCMVDGRWVQMGVASYVRSRYCEEGQSFYAEVFDYVDWIKKTIKNN